jgi:hypothetical protein
MAKCSWVSRTPWTLSLLFVTVLLVIFYFCSCCFYLMFCLFFIVFYCSFCSFLDFYFFVFLLVRIFNILLCLYCSFCCFYVFNYSSCYFFIYLIGIVFSCFFLLLFTWRLSAVRGNPETSATSSISHICRSAQRDIGWIHTRGHMRIVPLIRWRMQLIWTLGQCSVPLIARRKTIPQARATIGCAPIFSRGGLFRRTAQSGRMVMLLPVLMWNRGL